MNPFVAEPTIDWLKYMSNEAIHRWSIFEDGYGSGTNLAHFSGTWHEPLTTGRHK